MIYQLISRTDLKGFAQRGAVQFNFTRQLTSSLLISMIFSVFELLSQTVIDTKVI